MRRYLLIAGALLFLGTGLALACGGGDDGDSNGDGVGTAARTGTPGTGATQPAATAADGAENTPTEFETLRDALSDQLVGFGVNIGAVPDDVREQLLASCRELASFVERERVAELCEAIEQAIDGNDPGLVDLIVDQLAELKPN